MAEKYKDKGTDLVRQENINESAIIKVWTEVESHQYNPAISQIVFQHTVAPMMGKATDQAAIDAHHG